MKPAIVAIAAAIYGLGFAVLPSLGKGRENKAFWRAYTMVGAAIVGILAIVIFVFDW